MADTIPLAHVKATESDFELHSLANHLHGVARLSADFALGFGRDWAELAGFWHDLGKYRPTFQDYIRNASGYERENAHIEGKGRVDHSTAGAIHAIERFAAWMPQGGNIFGRIVAYLISGHHAGLPDWSGESGQGALEIRLQQRHLLEEALSHAPAEITVGRPPATNPPAGADPAFWIRMLFSCLVDADFLDTEAFMAPDQAVRRGSDVSLAQLETALTACLARFDPGEPGSLNAWRRHVLEDCRRAASLAPGLFSLTVPTGGGKTLSSLAFALRHALIHGKRRIIYVIPYTSIIEQTAEVFRAVFADFPQAVLEHHSNLDPTRETAFSRLASENWDAPIVVTTAVQYFESLFAARPGACRKLHNIADSVVILDEAQMLPPDFLMPVLHAIHQLSGHYGVTHVLCTATQPALSSRQSTDFRFQGLDDVREIVSDPDALAQALRRVDFKILPQSLEDWDDLLPYLQDEESFLCIVDRRDDARELYQRLPPGTVHLSGLMCGQHRTEVISRIKAYLAAGKPARVVSTQLIEAGVDVDFPVVFRAMAGLDAIAQAAGRCNREGRLHRGRVVIFEPPKPPPPGHLRQAAGIGKALLEEGLDPLEPATFKAYFQRLYWMKGDRLDKHGVLQDLAPDGQLRFCFRRAAEKFRLIDSAYETVIVPFGEGKRWIETLKNADKPERWLRRHLQRFTVNIPANLCQRLVQAGDVEEVQGLWVLVREDCYHAHLGLVPPDQPMRYQPDELIV